MSNEITPQSIVESMSYGHRGYSLIGESINFVSKELEQYMKEPSLEKTIPVTEQDISNAMLKFLVDRISYEEAYARAFFITTYQRDDSSKSDLEVMLYKIVTTIPNFKTSITSVHNMLLEIYRSEELDKSNAIRTLVSTLRRESLNLITATQAPNGAGSSRSAGGSAGHGTAYYVARKLPEAPFSEN